MLYEELLIQLGCKTVTAAVQSMGPSGPKSKKTIEICVLFKVKEGKDA
jgi:hypothetical protein